MTPKQNENLMKKILFVNLFFCALLHTFCILPLTAGVPQLINFQGELTDNAANPLTGSYSITFGLWSHQTSTDSAFCQWTETHSSVTVTDGLFNVLLGSVKTDTLGAVFESNDTLYLEKTVGEETLSPRVEVGSLGYAMRAGTVKGKQPADNVFPSSGNVGIGTTSPDEMLVIYNSDGEAWLKLHTAFETSGGIIFEDHGEEPPWERCVGKLYNDGGSMIADLPHDSFQFRRDGNPKLTIKSLTGKVGIGTSSPDSQLEICGAADQTFPVLHLVEGDSQTGDILKVDSFEEEPRFVIKQGGNVGIGTTDPQQPLQVGTTETTSIGKIRYAHRNNGNFRAWDVGTGFSETGLTDKFCIIDATGGGRELIIEPAGQGKVGIGRIPVTNNLEVHGTASKAIVGDWLANSDIRIKKDIQNLVNALDVINKLRPVRFRYIDDYKETHPSIKDHYYYSFIAQEFQEIFPDCVTDSGEKGYLQIDTRNVKPYLVAAVQELNSVVKETKKQNEMLKQRIEALETQLKN